MQFDINLTVLKSYVFMQFKKKIVIDILRADEMDSNSEDKNNDMIVNEMNTNAQYYLSIHHLVDMWLNLFNKTWYPCFSQYS